MTTPPRIPPPPPAGRASDTHDVPVFRPLVPVAALGAPSWSRLEVFRGVSVEALTALEAAGEHVHSPPGTMLITQRQPGEHMFILIEGNVRISVRGDMTDTFFERVLVAPAMFGEMALLTSEPRSASVATLTDVHCLRVDKRAFDALIARNPQAATILTKIVGDRLLETGGIKRVGKYQVEGRIGAGAVATVFSAVHPELGQEVALKMLSHALVFHQGFAEQFKREARIVASLNHEHIVRVLDTEYAYGTHFIVMEKLTGVLLEDLIESDQALAWGAVRRILKEIALALAYSHSRDLLHRDIKPSNVFLTEDRRAKLLDFGIAVTVDASESLGGHLLGTPYYMSPEQIRGDALDGRTDLYSLGIMAYELCTRSVPFDAETLDGLLAEHLNAELPDPLLLVADIPDDLVHFIKVSTAKRREDRFPTCEAAARFLQTAAELPLVNKIDLSTLAISYHPSRRRMVAEALRDLHQRLSDVAGVALLYGHQASTEWDTDA
jgi:predicted Ser/Thr protein kinase